MTTAPFELLFTQRTGHSLDVLSFRGKESLSKLYSFDVRCLCATDLLNPSGASTEPTRSPLLEERVILRMPHGHHGLAGGTRYVSGIVAAIAPEGQAVPTGLSTAPSQFWRIRIVPALWLAKHRVRSRIFQDLSVPEIVSQILGGHEYGSALGPTYLAWSLDRSQYAKRSYCMQYQESDFAFVRRILSEEGIIWFFEHGDATTEPAHETMVLLDEASQYKPLVLGTSLGTSPATLELSSVQPGAMLTSPLASFERKQEVRPNALLLRDYDYRRPLLDATASAPSQSLSSARYANRGDAKEEWWNWESKSRGSASATNDVDGDGSPDGVYLQSGESREGGATAGSALTEAEHDAHVGQQLRVYEHRSAMGATRAERIGEGEREWVDDERAARRLQAHRRNANRAKGSGVCRQMSPGHVFKLRNLAGNPGNLELDMGYVVTNVVHYGNAHGLLHPAADSQAIASLNDMGLALIYRNSFECVPANLPYRPKQRRKKRQELFESATVVGPAGNEVHTDKLGRIKVQFHWDLKGSKNENSSCWMRVMQNWTGTSFGAQFLPRVGSEVLVSFREGDHDRPIVIGSVYNGSQPPPFLPPEGMNRSGFRTRSTPGGSGYNELSFDDTTGHEQLTLRAQADMDTFVGRDKKTNILGSEVKQIVGRRTEHIGENLDHTVAGDQRSRVAGCKHDLVEGKSELHVGEDQHVKVHGAARHQIKRSGWLHAGDDLTTETEGNHTTVVGKHDAQRSFALHVEGTSQLKSTGITEIVSPKGLRLRCGNSVLEIMEDQISIHSDKLILHTPSAKLELQNDGDVWIDADKKVVARAATVALKGAAGMLQLDHEAKLLGPQIRFGSPGTVEGLRATERELTHIELKDEDGAPCANQRYILVFEDGSEQSGFLDADGKADLYLEQSAQVRFPGMLDPRKGAAE